MAKVALIIAFNNFRDEELFHTQEELEKLGHDTVIFSTQKGMAVGMLGGKVMVHYTIDELKVSDFGAIVFVGGTGSSVYFDNKTAHKIAQEAYAQKKVVGAICIAPSILANAGILNGKRATAFSSEQKNLTEKGARYTGTTLEVDGRIVTANGPAAARAFGKQIGKII